MQAGGCGRGERAITLPPFNGASPSPAFPPRAKIISPAAMYLLAIREAKGARPKPSVVFEGDASEAPEALLTEADILEASMAEMAEGSPEFAEERERGYVEFPAGEGVRGFAFPARPYAWAFCRWAALDTSALLCFGTRDDWISAAATTRRMGGGAGAGSGAEAAAAAEAAVELPMMFRGALRCSSADVLLARL